MPLHIETGRYTNKKVEDRICELCDANVIEDEQHFVCSCNLYSELRQEMYTKICESDINFIDMPQCEKFVYLMSKKQKLMSRFVHKAFQVRRKKLYES